MSTSGEVKMITVSRVNFARHTHNMRYRNICDNFDPSGYTHFRKTVRLLHYDNNFTPALFGQKMLEGMCKLRRKESW